MKLLTCAAMAAVFTMAAAQPVAAKDAKTYAIVNEAVGVPVFPHDLTDRPYKVLGEVKAGVRKATIFSKEASQEKIYRELWERAEKLGADAVVNAKYGDSHVTALSWGQTNATGTAVKFEAAATPAAPEAPAAPETPAPPATPASSEAAN
jgi:uncharacterized protein YbjQ (UPF0145 family)